MLSKIAVTIGGLFLMFVLALAAGLGVWAYGLNTQLAKVNTELQELKTSNEKLNSDYGNLSTGSVKATADLAAAQAQVESLQDELKKLAAENDSLKTENGSLKSKVSAVQGKVSILYAWWFRSEEAFDQKVKESGDAALKTLWEKAQKTKSDDDYYKLTDYMVQSIADMAGLVLFPSAVVNTG